VPTTPSGRGAGPEPTDRTGIPERMGGIEPRGVAALQAGRARNAADLPTGRAMLLARAARCGDNAGMDILLNGEARTLASSAPRRLSVLDLLQLEGLAQRRVAVEVNGAIVPRGQHADHLLRAGDRVEIVHALGGG